VSALFNSDDQIPAARAPPPSGRGPLRRVQAQAQAARLSCGGLARGGMLSQAAAPLCGSRQGCSVGGERAGLQRAPPLRRLLRRPVRVHAPVAWSAGAPARAAPGGANVRAARAAAAAASGSAVAVRAHGVRDLRAHARGRAQPGGAGGAPGYDSGSESENEGSAASGFGMTMSQLLERHRCARAPTRPAALRALGVVYACAGGSSGRNARLAATAP
jgi:hypothetical protein